MTGAKKRKWESTVPRDAHWMQSLVQDVADGAKHFLDKRPTEVREQRYFFGAGGEDAYIGHPFFQARQSNSFLLTLFSIKDYDGGYIDFIRLCENLIEEWRAFIGEHETPSKRQSINLEELINKRMRDEP
ncbi:MAG: hypothetical protein ACLQMF_02160 [Rectinemataceae bacterium]